MRKEEVYRRISRSKFRSSFQLNKDDIAYIDQKGWDTIKSHAFDFVRQKLAPAYPYHDTYQTPIKGHPVFKAMHACAMCCRKCLNKWYRVEIGKELSEKDIEKIVSMLMDWIEVQYRQKK